MEHVNGIFVKNNDYRDHYFSVTYTKIRKDPERNPIDKDEIARANLFRSEKKKAKSPFSGSCSPVLLFSKRRHRRLMPLLCIILYIH